MAGAAATSGRCHKNGKRQNSFSCIFVFFVRLLQKSNLRLELYEFINFRKD